MAKARGRRPPEIEIRLLGPLEVVRDREPVALGGPKPGALLAALALEVGRVVSVDLLVEALWPGVPPDTASHAVQVYVSQLRKALGAPTLTRRGTGYALELDPDRVDTRRFARLVSEGRELLASREAAGASTVLREALGLWRGPALADFTYEPFAQTEIARLEELRLDAVEARVDSDLALGRHVDLIPELEALVHSHPLREHPRAQLMLALYRSGRQADALAAYRAARDTLVGELGIEPGPELRELEAAILRQDESLLLAEAAPAAPAMQFRRLVTILFVDLVESMRLAAALDAEALGQVLRRYFDTVSAALARHGGTVEKYAGDAVMAVFGIPVTHEDDALRATRAAFDIRAGVAALGDQLDRTHGIGLEVRIGIVAGEVLAMPTESRQRFVAGEAVGLAARVQESAQAGEIVVCDVVARLIDHAARFTPVESLDVEGRADPFRIFRVEELVQPAPAFQRRLEAPLVGRKRELAVLRRTLRQVVDGASPRAALVVGPPGVGKSRLAAELTRRARSVAGLWGRCLAYGDGTTYWPLREVLEQAGESEERDTVLAALDSDPPLPAAEVALLFRRFCEARARERQFVLIIDDVHWADPTLLDLVDQLVDRGTGPMLLVCLAREELLEEMPAFLEGRSNVVWISLDALPPADADMLVDALGGAALGPDQRARVLEAAEGNPLFLEQLLALALEGGLSAGAIPPTVQALLAARLDRLGPGERAVLERGAVVGKEFTARDVVALLDPEAVPTVSTHLESLADRGFVRPGGDGALAFRHGLVQEAVYRAAPKRLRAELHERFADRLDEAYSELPDLDELVGFHLEQAYRLRKDLGEFDRRAEQVGEDAGRRLGEAGFRALKRGDMTATVRLLDRAIALLPPGDEARHELMCELGIARYTAGDTDAGAATFLAAIAGAEQAKQRRIELRARIEAAYLRLLREPEGAARNLLSIAEGALPVFEALEDERALARTWLLIGYIRGGIHGDHAAWEEAEERALGYYRSTAFPPATCVGQIAAAIYWGPTTVPAGIERCSTLIEDETIGLAGRAAVVSYLGGLHAQTGQFERARDVITQAEHTYRELGAENSAMTTCGTVRADTEILAGDHAAAEATLRAQCEFFERVHDRSHLAVRAAKLAEALYAQARFDEAAEWAGVSRARAASDDLSVQLILGSVEAKLLARNGALSDARRLVEETVRRADGTDGLNQIAWTRLALSEVLRAADLVAEAEQAVRDAIRLYERKGNAVAAARATEILPLAVSA